MGNDERKDLGRDAGRMNPLLPDKPPPAVLQHFPEIMTDDDELFLAKNRTVLSIGGSGYVYKCSGDVAWKLHASAREVDFMRAAGDCCVPLLSRVIQLDKQGRGMTCGHVTELGKPFDCKAIPVEKRDMVKSELIALLTCLHARGIVHGDIKPANLVWCRDGTLRFCDFGDSRWILKKRSKCLDEPVKITDKEPYEGGNIHSTVIADRKKRPSDDNTKDAKIKDTRNGKKGKTIKADTEAVNTKRTDNDSGTEASIKGAENKKRPRTRAVAKAEAEASKAKKAEAREADAKDTHTHSAHDRLEGAQGPEAQDNRDGVADDDDYDTEWNGMASLEYTAPNRGVEDVKPPVKIDDWYALGLILWEIYTGERALADIENDGDLMEFLEAGGTVDIMAVKDESAREYIKKLLLAGGARICGPVQSPRSSSS